MMKKVRNRYTLIASAIFMLAFFSCEQDVAPRNILYTVKGLSSEYKITYTKNGENYSEVVQNGDTKISFLADRGEILYFDIKYKDEVHKMSNFAATIAVNKRIFRRSYAYDMKWADSATVNIPYPFEIILSGTVPY